MQNNFLGSLFVAPFVYIFINTTLMLLRTTWIKQTREIQPQRDIMEKSHITHIQVDLLSLSVHHIRKLCEDMLTSLIKAGGSPAVCVSWQYGASKCKYDVNPSAAVMDTQNNSSSLSVKSEKSPKRGQRSGQWLIYTHRHSHTHTGLP